MRIVDNGSNMARQSESRSVLTNADLDVGTPITESRCGVCEDCKKICPAGAVTGKQLGTGHEQG